MSMSTKNSQITEIVQKFHQLSMKIKVNLINKNKYKINYYLALAFKIHLNYYQFVSI